MKKIQGIWLLLIVLASCSVNTENNKLILGDWYGAEWLVDGHPSGHNSAATHFNFNEKEEYRFDYPGSEEKGTYKVENDMLFTKPEGRLEIMVRIQKLTKDTLIFDMNRSGASELLTLVRKGGN
jgi:hypothetical protein